MLFKEIAIAILALISGLYFIKFMRESRFNYLLKQKQKLMRVENGTQKFKRSTLVKSLVPALSIALIMLLNPNVEFVPSGVNNNVNIAKITSVDDILRIRKEFEEQAKDASQNYTRGEGAVMESAPGTQTLDGATSKSSSYTETNTQVAGVDEIDNVKTDGKYIYTLHDGDVVVTLAYPKDQLEVYKRISFYKDEECVEETCSYEYPNGVYVDDDKLIVIVNKNTHINWRYVEENKDDNTKEILPRYGRNKSETVVYIYDKNNFELTSTYSFDGYMAGTRKIDDNLFVITNTYLNTEDEDILPTYSVNGTQMTSDFSDIIYLEDTNPNSFTNLYGIDLDKDEIDVESILGGTSSNLYVSNNNIYTIDRKYDFRIMTADTMTTSIVAENRFSDSTTTISRFSINGNEIKLAASGEVKGNPLNQFSMDEFDGHFRITTTNGWGEELNNRLYVLDGNLEEVAKLENLGKPGERLQSTRFMGDTAYLVTFMQTDPFYVIDLKDQSNPEILGELEITGFSSYLHPINDTHVLGIGFEANEKGRNIGLKMSIYDVSDQVNPKEIHKEVMYYEENGWSYSSVTYNHKDLLFDLEKGIIGFPFDQSNYAEDISKYKYESGYLVYKFDLDKGFDELGYVTHGDSEFYNHMYKGLFIDDNLYTISSQYIAVSNISDIDKLDEIINLSKNQLK